MFGILPKPMSTSHRTGASSHFLSATFLTTTWMLSLITLLSFNSGAVAKTLDPMSLANDYGQLPTVRSVSISPNGEHLAFIQQMEQGEVFMVINRAENKLVGAANASSLKARSVYFASDTHVILVISRTRASVNVRGKWEQDVAVAYNIANQEITSLPSNNLELYHAQSGMGNVVGVNQQNHEAFIGAFIGATNPANHLLRIDMRTGRGVIHAKGSSSTRDWFVGRNGNVLVREDFQNKANKHIVYSYASGKRERIYEKKTELPEINLAAISHDEQHLFFVGRDGNNEGIYSMSLADGSISGPQLVVEDRDIDRMISLGANRHLVGIQYSGLLPQYNILIEEANAVIDGIQNHFPTSTITPLSATTDYNQMVFRVSGNQGAASYYIFDRSKNAITNIAAGYPNVSQAQIGRISAVRYSANDGLKIPAILTWPVGVENPKNLPLLVFPHGGPEAYDRMSFDWWAQYFARQGYLVFQPNFRGSAGFGTKFMHAGRGEWGRRMQQDVTDGVNELIRAGHADADRVCIMGASYGGYSALAGGAFTPDLYRCVVSFGGVSDLPKMLSDEAFYNGSTHWVVSYWNRVIGDSKKERQKLKDISPINFAAQFSAPVLLMHGRDDTVVHPRQSRRMHKALKRAKKTVEYVEFKGEDHWLSDSATRVAMLQEISKFLAVHNPPRLQSSSQVHIAPDPLN